MQKSFATIFCLLLWGSLELHTTCGEATVDEFNLDETIVELPEDSLTERLVKREEGSRTSTKLGSLVTLQKLSRRYARATDEYKRSDAMYTYMRTILRILDYFIGTRGPRVDIRHFVNYDSTVEIANVFFVKPRYVYEVRRVLRAANTLGMRVRAFGHFQSRSPLFGDEGHIMMDVTELERHDGPRMQLNDVTVARNFKTVTAMTGVYEYELNEFLVRNQVAMYSQPITTNGTVGGMVAASSHGSTWDYPAFSGYVVEMRLLDYKGRLRRFTMERHPDIMKALICNLGLFGIMYDITLKVYPTKIVRVDNSFTTMGEIIYNRTNMKTIVENHFLTEMTWYPFSGLNVTEEEEYVKSETIPDAWSIQKDVAWLRTIDVVMDPSTVKASEIQGPLYLPTKGALSGGNVTGLLRAKGAVAIAKQLPSVSFHQIVDAFPTILPPVHGKETSQAYMLTVDDQFQTAQDAMLFILQASEDQIRSNKSTPVNALLPRFIKNIDCYICPTSSIFNEPGDTGRSIVIDFLAPPLQYGYTELAKRFVDSFRAKRVRPHWGKRHDNIEGIIDVIKEVYGNNIKAFNDARTKADVDPCGMFDNSYLQQIFGMSWC